MSNDSLSTVAVIGGGISGLAAAHRLITAGAGEALTVTLIEEAPRLGGKVITEHNDGFLLEGGPDSFVTGKGSVLELAAELGITDRVISSRAEHRGAYVWSRGRLHPLPDGLLLMAPSRVWPVLRTSVLSVKGRLRVLGDLLLPRGPAGDQSLEQFVARRLGREMLERIAEPLVAGIHSAEPSSMSLAASFPRFLDMERTHRSLILAARAAAAKAAASDSVTGRGFSYFASFKDGMGELSDALAKSLTGVAVKTGRGVTRLTRSNPGAGFRLTLDDGSEVQARGVVLATPARETAALLSDVVPAASSLVAGIKQVATATVTLVYRASDVPGLTGSGFVVPAVERRRIMGASYLSRKWMGRVPEPNFEMVRVFVGGSQGQELAMSGEARLLAVAREELAGILGLTADPVRATTRAWAGGLHQYTLGHVERMSDVESALSGYPALKVAGAGFHGIGLNECVQSGRNAADAVLMALSDRGSLRSPDLLVSGGAN
ncbi:MAG TPA: protoporphyrinogen oxidase [Acidimicrobiia bacterium]|nr:protoporphyrinogen oxidase [Acidimicrobiia bacterium]